MAIRQDNIAYDHISYCPMYPKIRVIDTLKRNGFKRNFHGIVPTKLIPALLSDSRVETLMKSGKINHLRHFLFNPQTLDRCWNSYKIAMRNKYDISDMVIWCDLVYLLDKLGKDLRNPHFVCPPDLKAAHDRYMENGKSYWNVNGSNNAYCRKPSGWNVSVRNWKTWRKTKKIIYERKPFF